MTAQEPPIVVYFPPDVRRWIEQTARAHGVKPETIVRERMRELAEFESLARGIA